MATLQERVAQLEEENANLTVALDDRDSEIDSLKHELAGPSGGGRSAGGSASIAAVESVQAGSVGAGGAAAGVELPSMAPHQAAKGQRRSRRR